MFKYHVLKRSICDVTVFDRDCNGSIGVDEMQAVLHVLGERLTDEEVSEMMKEADIDGHGEINLEGSS